MDIFNRLSLDGDRQSGFSKLYVVEKLIDYYGGVNCLVDSQTGYTDPEVIVSNVRLSDSERVRFNKSRLYSTGDGFVRGQGGVASYVMYTAESVTSRFTGFDQSNPSNLVMVKDKGTLEYFSPTGGWTAFSATVGDRIVAEMDDRGRLTIYDSIRADVINISAGYEISDLSMDDEMSRDEEAAVINSGTYFALEI